MSPKSDASQISFDLLFKNNPLPMWIYDLQTLAFLEVNDAAVKKYGFSRKKFLTLTLKDIRPKEDVERLMKDVSKKRPPLQQSRNWRHKLKSGKIIDVEITSHTIKYNERKAALVTARDITDQKLAGEKINKLNKVYSVLSDVNQTIVRTRNEKELFNSICRIAVEKGGYAMAWIGMVDTKENKVKVIASAGVTKDYLNKINIDLNDKKRGGGPTGLAVKTGKHVISNNIESDKRMLPWRKDAIKYGYKSSASFPIKVFGKVVGSFTLYSSQELFFNDEEIKLLDEMVMDLSFALEFFEEEKVKKEAEQALRESEEHLSITLNSIGDAVISTNNKGILNKMNPTAEKLCGWKLNDAKGKHLNEVFKIINADSRIAIDSPFEKVIKTGKVIGLANHTILISRNGTERNIADSAAPIKDANGKIKGVVLVFSDVTEAYKTRKKLERNEQLLQESQKIARLGNYTWDLSKGFWTSSKILDDIFGIDKNYIRSLEGWAAIIHPDFRETMTKYVTEKVLAKRKRFDKEYKIVRIKDGKERWVHGLGELELDNNKQPLRLKGTISDITERKHTEEASLKSKIELRAILESTADGILAVDQDGKVIKTNNRFAELWRIPETLINSADDEALLTFVLNQLISPEEFLNKVHELYNSTDEDLDTLIFKDGRVFERFSTPLLMGDKINGRVWSFRDITKQKQAEETLRKSEERFRNLVENINEVFYISDAQGKIEYCSPNISASTGFTLKEILGNFYLRLIAPIDRRMVVDHYLEQNSNGSSDSVIEFRVRCKDGTIIWVEQITHFVRDANGNVVEYRNVARNINDRKQAESKLQNERLLLRTLIDNIPDSIYLKDLALRKTLANSTEVRYAGAKSEAEVLGKTDFEVYPKELAERFFADDQSVIQTGKAVLNREEFILDEKEQKRWLLSSKIPLRDRDGRIIGLVGIGRDISERKQVEEELRKSREELLKFFEDDISADFITTPSGKLLQCNKTFLELFGFKSKEEALAFPIEKLYTAPSDRNRFIELIKKNKKIENFEGELLSLDGKIIYTIQNAFAEFDDAGELIQIRVYILNITKRKKAEEELKKLSRVVEQSPASVVITNQDGDIEYVNDKFCKVTGYSKEEVFGKNPRILKSNHHDKNFYADFWSRLLSGKDWKGEMLNKKKNGELFWESVLLSPLLNKEGDITNFVAVKEDITERKKREEEIVMLADALKSISECVSITDKEDKIIFVNDSFAKTYGYSQSELIGKHISNFRSPNNPQTLIDEILPSTLRGGWQGELWNKRKDGSEFLIYLSTKIINNKEGKLIGLIGVASDITERKTAEMELIKAKELANQSNRLKDAFIANMSHEIRTPLNGILGLSEIIKDMYAEHIKEEDKELFAGIEHSSKRIIRTIDMILNYSRIQTGDFPVAHRKIELSSICENLVKEFFNSAKSKSLKFSFENSCSKSTSIFADEYSVTHAISNLIDNAIKYTNNGFVDVCLYNGKDDDIMLDVKDSGIGISEGYIQHIFEPYQQEQMGYGRAYEGVGLGLPMVKKFLLLNNASIAVKSTKAKGTIFTVNFGKSIYPAEEKMTGEKIIKNISISERKNLPLVLIVEDDKINQSTIERFIEKNFRAISTDSSDEAIELLKNNKVDIILMDISIKGSMNGLELTKELKASKEYPGIPVIAITAHAFESDRLNAMKAGCDEYLSKPFSRNSLLDTIGKFVL